MLWYYFIPETGWKSPRGGSKSPRGEGLGASSLTPLSILPGEYTSSSRGAPPSQKLPLCWPNCRHGRSAGYLTKSNSICMFFNVVRIIFIFFFQKCYTLVLLVSNENVFIYALDYFEAMMFFMFYFRKATGQTLVPLPNDDLPMAALIRYPNQWNLDPG